MIGICRLESLIKNSSGYIFLAGFCLFCKPVLAVDVASLLIESLQGDEIEVTGIQTELEFQAINQLRVNVSADSLVYKQFGPLQDVHLHCLITIIDQSAFDCPSGKLTAHYQSTPVQIDFSIAYQDKFGFDGKLVLNGEQLPINALPSLLNAVNLQYPGGHDVSGQMDTRIEIVLAKNSVNSIQIESNLENVNYSGDNVLESMDISLNLDAEYSNKWQFDSHIHFSQGLMYISPGVEVLGEQPGFYLDLSEHHLSVNASGSSDAGFKNIVISDYLYEHPGLIALRGDLSLDMEAEKFVSNFSLSAIVNDLGVAFPVYIEPLLLATPYSELELAGSLGMKLQFNDEILTDFNLDLDNVYLHDVNERFSVSDLSTDIQIGKDIEKQLSTLQWRSFSIYKLIVGAGDITLMSDNNSIEVIDWQDIDILDGELLINRFSMDNIGQSDFKIGINGELTPISLHEFTQTMDWPLMSGRLSGEIEGLEYHQGNLSVNGDIAFRVFDGEITISDLTIDNLFDVNSRLYTNVNLQALDLEQLTETFSFGKIEGSLEGYLHDVTLVNWQPVYLDVVLKSPENDPRPHRISQKALDNLSEIGGGLSGPLSTGLIRFIPEYSYGRLGIRCLLHNNVCNLGGIEEAEDGFYIMTRGGLLPPWVDVKGTGRSIIWQDLIKGLKRIAEGEIVFE